MERLWNRNYRLAMGSNMALYFAFYLLAPLLPIYLSETYGAGKDMIGLVLSGFTVAALVTRLFSGYLVDSFDRKRVLMTAYLLFAVFFAGYLVVSSLLLFAIVRTLHGGPFGTTTVANSTAAIDVLPSSRRNEGIGFYGLSNNVGMALGPLAGVALYNYTHNFELLFWVALLIALAGLLTTSCIRIPTRELQRGKRKLSLDRFFLGRAWLLAVNIAMFSFSFGVLSNYLAIYTQDVLGMSSGTSAYFLILSAGLIISRFQGASALRKGRLTHNAGEGILFSLAGYTIFALWHHPAAYYLSALLIGLGNGHMYPAFLNMFIHMAQHNERGTANSSILVAWDLGFGFGILVGGVAAEYTGYTGAFITAAAVNAIGVALFFASTRCFFLRRRLWE